MHGNHGPLDGWSASLQWPNTVKVFGGDSVEYIDLQREGATIARVYGISYKMRDVSDNLALPFEHRGTDYPVIGLLHADVGGNMAHEAYAPASVDDLLGRGRFIIDFHPPSDSGIIYI